MDRNARLLGMRDVLEHLGRCYDEWRAADTATAEQLLASAVKRDLDELWRLCDGLERDSAQRQTTPTGRLVRAA